MAELITVKSAKQDGRVCLWEVNAAHPDGEIFISGDGKPHKVARTSAVQQRLNAGVLVEVKTPKIVETVAEVVADAVEAAADAVAKPSRKRKGE